MGQDKDMQTKTAAGAVHAETGGNFELTSARQMETALAWNLYCPRSLHPSCRNS